ncbi:putative kynurenine formamidase [Wickerhamomyces ciferrii]|uniref:Kynurenine formamidase n=1 Tax=Wickerhamomyces ciferrii (strain ATCC 14091 / BCRC 22168 / CBS 111 / JCM 3599 / NBRC 0793 / NRRL Y-1031 F-60-10) TaxID=1206466 RepID=K0KHB9_WICCF|nr:putative kynurenine formamidase [Wickerhamomyces ciferrii]CCH44610.1 putative kynurenine formamidase [Wickerhamomyces ciferrii]
MLLTRSLQASHRAWVTPFPHKRSFSTKSQSLYKFRLRPKFDTSIVRKHWGSHPRQYVEVFKYDPSFQETIIAVHGGGWIDYTQQATDLIHIQKGLKSNINMFSLEYRLSKPKHSPLEIFDSDDYYVKDPYHLIDTLQGLKNILDNYKVSKIHLLGHSVGGFLVLQIQDFQRIIPDALEELVICGEITKDESKVQLDFINNFAQKYAPKIDLINVFYLGGIYDVKLCIENANESRWNFCYIDDAFVSKTHYLHSSPLTTTSKGSILGSLCARREHVIINCFHDEYIGNYSPLRLMKWLNSQGKTTHLKLGSYNRHFGMLRHKEVHKIIDDTLHINYTD